MACGVVRGMRGELLLAQRPAGKVAAGWWEFPGGKIERGESARAALARELYEELGLVASRARPLMRLRHAYSDRIVMLDAWLVAAFDGEPRGREGQAWRWVRVEEVGRLKVLPTVAPILSALRLPEHYVFTPPDIDEPRLRAGLPDLPAGALLRLRLPSLCAAAYERLALCLLDDCRALGLRLVLDREPQQARALGAAGWHAGASRAARLTQRAVPATMLMIGSAHGRDELMRLCRLGADAAVVGTVQPSASHPGGHTLGWAGFADVVDHCGLPCYAIGGLGPDDLPAAFAAGAQGVAAISAYWSRGSSSRSASGG